MVQPSQSSEVSIMQSVWDYMKRQKNCGSLRCLKQPWKLGDGHTKDWFNLVCSLNTNALVSNK